MFKIDFFIYNEMISKIKNINLEEFNREWGSIYGAIKLSVNNKKYGDIIFYEDIGNFKNLEEKKTFFEDVSYQECLETWIENLLEVYNSLKSGKRYIAISTVETPHYLEFEKINNHVYISLIEAIKIKGEKRGDSVTRPIYLYKKNYDSSYDDRIKKEELFKNEKVNYLEFLEEILTKAKLFIKNVEEINPILLESDCMRVIIKNIAFIKRD